MAPAGTDIVEGGVYYLPCVAYSRTGKAVTITWQDAEGSVINNSSKLAISESGNIRDGIYVARSVLTVSCASFEDAQQYTCIATDGAEQESASFDLQYTCKCKNMQLVVIIPLSTAVGPSIEPVDQENHVRMEGESISLSCITSGQPTPIVMWHKDRQPLTRDYETREDIIPERVALNSTLIMHGLTAEDSGVYSCRAENKLGHVHMNYSLTVEPQAPGITLKLLFVL